MFVKLNSKDTDINSIDDDGNDKSSIKPYQWYIVGGGVGLVAVLMIVGGILYYRYRYNNNKDGAQVKINMFPVSA